METIKSTWWDLGSIKPRKKVLVLWRDEGRFHPVTNADLNPIREVSFASGQDAARLVMIKKAHKEGKYVEVNIQDDTGYILGVRVRE